MRHYCTLFNSKYLFKGLALYSSLRMHGGEFMLYVLCMDERTYEILSGLELPSMQLVRLVDFEDYELRHAKRDRTFGEYCWTCTPSLPLFVLKQFPDVDHITYLDADIFLFSSPEPIFEEMGAASILITEHRFTERLQYQEVNGIYNVQFVSFRRDERGLKCLHWWRERCNEWCYNRLEETRKGDQKYLDKWPTQFEGVHVLQHVGAGVAPWNFPRYRIEDIDGHLLVEGQPLIFYHFHQFRILRGGRYYLMSSMYTLDTPAPLVVYQRYIKGIEAAMETVQAVQPQFIDGIESNVPVLLQGMVRRFFPRALKDAIKKHIGNAVSKPN